MLLRTIWELLTAKNSVRIRIHLFCVIIIYYSVIKDYFSGQRREFATAIARFSALPENAFHFLFF